MRWYGSFPGLRGGFVVGRCSGSAGARSGVVAGWVCGFVSDPFGGMGHGPEVTCEVGAVDVAWFGGAGCHGV